MEIEKFNQRLVTTKSTFTVTVLVATLTILSIWLFGLGSHNTIFFNSILSTSILSITFFLFISVGLFKGIKLKDNLGKITDNIKSSKIPNFANIGQAADFVNVGEGFGGVVLIIILWIVVTISIIAFLWLFGAVLWTSIIVFIAILYWVFFRALRLVFKNSNKCKGNLTKSITFGLGYTLLYNLWIYVIIMTVHYLHN